MQDIALIAEMKSVKARLMEENGYPPLIPWVKELLDRLQQAGYAMAVASFLSVILHRKGNRTLEH